MLDLKRASAGSGKTFQLAKYYIRYFISILPEGENRRRLRKPEEIHDGLGSILAVTFTNKATAEMQMRIVEKIDALARNNPASGGSKPDYLDDFCDEFGVMPQDISNVCAKALRVLLTDYSRFNVSTIDSFFQQVLRTFAYESGYSDSYQVELDSKNVSRIGLDSTLDAIDSPDGDDSDGVGRRWVTLLMDNDESEKWNIFQKKISSVDFKGSKSSYEVLLHNFDNLDDETFRANRDTIEDFLANADGLLPLYNGLEEAYLRPVRQLYEEMLAEAERLAPKLLQNLPLEASRGIGKINVQLRRIQALKWNAIPSSDKNCPVEIEEKYLNGKPVKDHIKNGESTLLEWTERLEGYHQLYDKYCHWRDELLAPETKLWLALRVSFPFLGLLQIVTRKRNEYLQENNSVELGETSMILNRIIGDSDTPFVYERMGTYLNHFLIDEFQDTSMMQWSNVHHLIDESLSRGNDNLIIGDAKQSIYRFRNAAPQIISEIVPRDYDSVIPPDSDAGMDTNFRSDLKIVDWNNRFFTFAVGELIRVSSRPEHTADYFGSLYSNVVQKARSKDGGYVRTYLKKAVRRRKSSDPLMENEQREQFDVLDETVNLVLDSMHRGYRMKDICVLVRSNKKGTEVVEKLRGWNCSHPDERPIEFVSEESLLIGNSDAVRNIVVVLRSIANGCRPDVDPERAKTQRGPLGNVRDLECSLLLFRVAHPDMSAAEAARLFPEKPADSKMLVDLLADMQTIALPAMVEAIVSKFITPEERHRDAPFIAAFQDAVLEYCESHPSDLPSFLYWWDSKCGSLSISSPEDADAVRIMTIHKAKGLEFPVVIIPQLLSPSARLGEWTGGKEWRWINTSELRFSRMRENQLLPPWMPVRVSEALRDTVLQPVLMEGYDLETMDNLNLLYVAMTRAVNELYIFADRGSDKTADITVGRVLENFTDSLVGEARMSEDDNVLRIEFGECPAQHVRGEKDKDREIVTLAEYNSGEIPDCLRCREASLPEVVEDDEYDEDADLDPRSMGNVCHGIMERVATIDDIPREAERARMLGLMGGNEDYAATLMGHVEKVLPQVAPWFDAGVKRVVAERSLLRRGRGLRRPDRIVEFSDGTAAVIDYKFGREERNAKYARQVRDYVDTLKDTGRYRGVKGYLWYVFLDKVVFVSD